MINSYIGTDVSGANAIPNKGDGVKLENGTTQNTIGGTVAGSLNVISGNNAPNVGNTGFGVEIVGSSKENHRPG